MSQDVSILYIERVWGSQYKIFKQKEDWHKRAVSSNGMIITQNSNTNNQNVDNFTMFPQLGAVALYYIEYMQCRSPRNIAISA